MSKTVCVVPTIRPDRMAEFRAAWAPLFGRHGVTLVTVWDGDRPYLTTHAPDGTFLAETAPGVGNQFPDRVLAAADRDLFCRRSDVVRNLGFVGAAVMGADYVLTLDDDVAPVTDPDLHPHGWEVYGGKRINDPIAAHLDALSKRVPLSWMNTAHCGAEYLRGVPYGVRAEAPVMLSHGVWVGTPDFDGETQVRLGKAGGVPRTLPYHVGPVPRGVLFPLCGMNVMVRREALPYLYFAPMGPDSGVNGLHRFGDIWMGAFLKRAFDEKGWACYTGASTVLHTRASDAARNFEQEKLGREWNEWVSQFLTDEENLGGYGSPEFWQYLDAYNRKRLRYAALIKSIQEKT